MENPSWKYGDICKVNNWAGEYIYGCEVPYTNGSEVVVFRVDSAESFTSPLMVNINDIHKPLDKDQQSDQEKMQAAYALYKKCNGDIQTCIEYELFAESEESKTWLKAVEETNYTN